MKPSRSADLKAVSQDAPPTGRSRRAWTWAGALLIVAAAVAAYADSFQGAFQFDDLPALLDNATLRHLWPLWGPLSPPAGALTVSGRPILNLSFALNYAISGYQPWSYHALNLLIHLGAALVLFGIVRRTLAAGGQGEREEGRADGLALAAALIWTVHPLQTESVTYIVQRAESLAGLFYLLTLYGFIRSVASPRPRAWAAASVAACLFGVATKEIVVTAPVVVWLYDRTFVTGGWGRAWRAHRGYYLALAATWLPLLALVAGTGWDRGSTSGFHVGVSWVGYWLTQGEAVTRYVGLAFWPHPLAFDYGPSLVPRALAWLAFAVLLAALAGTVVGCWRGRPWAFLAGASFLILAPTSVMPGVLQFMADHPFFRPWPGGGGGGVGGGERVVESIAVSSSGRRRVSVLGVALIVLALATGTIRRNLAYRDDLTLWMDTVAHRPGSALAQANAGGALLARGRNIDAVAYCLEAVRLDPMKPNAHYNLGLAYENLGRPAEALREFALAAWINPKLFYAQFREGRLLDRSGRYAEAERVLRLAVATAPDYGAAYASLGVALAGEGRPQEAVAALERALRLDAAQPEVEYDLGIALAALGRRDEALTHYGRAVRLQPDYPEAQLNLGVTLAQLGRFPEAMAALRHAVRLKPDSADAHGNLAAALEELGRSDEAVAEYRAALRLRPHYPEAHYNLGNALLRAHDLAGARAEFAETLRLKPEFAPAREMIGQIDRYLGRP